MDDFTAILQQDFGLKPQGKSAPMAAVKTVGISNSGSSRRGKSFEVSSILSSKSSASSLPPDALEDDLLFAGNGTNISGTGSWLGSAEPFVYDDVFGGPPKFPTSASKSPFMQNYDDISPKSKTSFHKASSLPVFDAPVFDDDIFGGVPGVRKISVAYEDVFSSGLATASSAAAFTDFSGGYAAMETKIGYGARETNLRYGATGIKAGDGATGTKAGYGTKTAKARYIATEMKARDDSTDTKVGSNATDMKVGSRTTERKVGFGVTDNKAKKSSRSSSEHPSTIDFGASDMAYDEQACKSLTHETRKNVFEFWITVDDVKLVTQPCSAAPPARSPPVCGLKSNKEEANEDVTLDFSTYFVQKRSDSTYQTGIDSPIKSTVNNSSSLIEELEEFASGGLKTLKGANVDTASCSASDEEQTDESATAAASSAAMKHAMERAEARLKRVKEARDREREETAKLVTEGEQGRKARERKGRQCASESEGKAHETGETERELMAHETEECEEREQMVQEEGQEHAACEAQEQEERNRLAREAHEKKEREGAACERDERERAACGIHEREEKERKVKERRRKDREKKKERERDRIAVERATQDARGRAEAKAVAEAREKAERAAVERATAEARGRAAVEASERAAVKRAAAEARARTERAGVERANAEARERAAERAAVERAAAEAQERAERAAVECVTAEKVAAAREQKQKYENDLDAFFMGASRTSSEPRQRSATSEVPSATAQTSRGVQNGGERVFTGTTAGVRKVASVMTDDFTSLFNPTTNDFPNVDGETLERRRARLERYQRTHERAAKALEEKNQRDLQCQREQAERHRASEMLDLEIKRWATGKEGNLRALLSTLQYVLWPECGWQPVSLIDLITSAAVKKVYRKATLCVHPDKVQQKGATIRQKYIAEKVFDLLKEAWNKFNSEELF